MPHVIPSPLQSVSCREACRSTTGCPSPILAWFTNLWEALRAFSIEARDAPERLVEARERIPDSREHCGPVK